MRGPQPAMGQRQLWDLDLSGVFRQASRARRSPEVRASFPRVDYKGKKILLKLHKRMWFLLVLSLLCFSLLIDFIDSSKLHHFSNLTCSVLWWKSEPQAPPFSQQLRALDHNGQMEGFGAGKDEGWREQAGKGLLEATTGLQSALVDERKVQQQGGCPPPWQGDTLFDFFAPRYS